MADEIKPEVKAEAPKAAEVKVAPAPVVASDPVKEAVKLLLTHFAKHDATQQEQNHAVALLDRLR